MVGRGLGRQALAQEGSWWTKDAIVAWEQTYCEIQAPEPLELIFNTDKHIIDARRAWIMTDYSKVF